MRKRTASSLGITRAAGAQEASRGPRILWAAGSLLSLVAQLRVTGFLSKLPRLREKIAVRLTDFQSRARSAGIDAARAAQAADILAAVIDHVVTSMPWGADAGWQSLGSGVSGSGDSGSAASASSSRRPEQRLLEAARAASSDDGLCELLEVALAVGFEKPVQGAENPQIEQLRQLLASRRPTQAAALGQALSPGWQRVVAGGKSLTSWLPLWVSSLAAAALLALLFVGLEVSLGAKSDRTYAAMAGLNGPAAARSAPVPAPQPRLAGALAEPLAAQTLALSDEIDRSVIVVSDAKLFEPGDAALLPESAGLLRPIAASLGPAPGRIRIIGHTDAGEVRAARYPSDWDLSVDRARAIAQALQGLGIDSSRLSVDGRAGVEPLLPGDPARSVSGNGRIEIVLLAGR
jgi:type VI secretion system protein ImpK